MALGLAALALVLLVVVQFVPFADVQVPAGTQYEGHTFTAWGQQSETGSSTWLSASKGAGLESLQTAGFLLVLGTLLAATCAVMILLDKVGIGGGVGIAGALTVAVFGVLMLLGLNAYVDAQFNLSPSLGPGAALTFLAFAALGGGGIVAVLPATREATDPTRPRGPTLSVANPKAFDPLASMDDPKRFQPDPPKDYQTFEMKVAPKTFKPRDGEATKPAEPTEESWSDEAFAPPATPAPAPKPNAAAPGAKPAATPASKPAPSATRSPSSPAASATARPAAKPAAASPASGSAPTKPQAPAKPGSPGKAAPQGPAAGQGAPAPASKPASGSATAKPASAPADKAARKPPESKPKA